MCECCGNNADQNQSHLHVKDINCNGCLGGLKETLADVPGVLRVDFVEEKKQGKVIYDKRIIETEKLVQTLADSGYSVA